MAEFERRIAHWKYDEEKKSLVCIPPQLHEGERELIVNFHDELTMHHNEHFDKAWYVLTASYSSLSNTDFHLGSAGMSSHCGRKGVVD